MNGFKNLKLGWISYLNLHPLFCEIKKELPNEFSIFEGTPAEVNQMLRVGAVDLAPSSSVCLLVDSPKEYLPMGVVSRGKVLSVYLGFKKSHSDFFSYLQKQIFSLKNYLKSEKCFYSKESAKKILSFSSASVFNLEMPKIIFTKESQTSTELAKVLLTSLLGKTSFDDQVQSEEPVELLIGDKALRQRHEFDEILDLGELWWDLTGFPFVYAVMQSNFSLDPGIKEKFMSLALLAQTKMHEDPKEYLASFSDRQNFLDDNTLCEYWKTLFYRVDQEAMKGLELFLDLVRVYRASL